MSEGGFTLNGGLFVTLERPFTALRQQLIEDYPGVLTGRAVVVAADLSWVQLPSGDRLSLGNLGPPRRLLGALMKAHVRGDAVASKDYLVSEAWEGQRMAEASGANRLRVAVATLRRLGLRDIVQTAGAGYRLNPAHRYRWHAVTGAEHLQVVGQSR